MSNYSFFDVKYVRMAIESLTREELLEKQCLELELRVTGLENDLAQLRNFIKDKEEKTKAERARHSEELDTERARHAEELKAERARHAEELNTERARNAEELAKTNDYFRRILNDQ